jgi:hypothetical protein
VCRHSCRFCTRHIMSSADSMISDAHVENINRDLSACQYVTTVAEMLCATVSGEGHRVPQRNLTWQFYL